MKILKLSCVEFISKKLKNKVKLKFIKKIVMSWNIIDFDHMTSLKKIMKKVNF